MKPMLYAGSFPMSILRGIIVIILSTTTLGLLIQQADTPYRKHAEKLPGAAKSNVVHNTYCPYPVNWNACTDV